MAATYLNTGTEAPNATARTAGRLRQGTLWSTLTDVCRLVGIAGIREEGSEPTLFAHRRFKAGQTVYAGGQAFDALYVVHGGFLKNSILDEAGNERVLGFPMRGDVLGADAIAAGRHGSEATALTDVDLIVLPFAQITALGRTNAALKSGLCQVISREIAREHALLGLFGTLGAEARVARFLSVLAERYAAMGYSSREFQLRMTRQEIGSFLGLTLETVSRALSSLDAADVVRIDQRNVEVRDEAALRTLTRLASAAPRAAKSARAPRATPSRAGWMQAAA